MKFFKILLLFFIVFTACKQEQVKTNIDENISVDSLSLKKEAISKLNYKDIGIDAKAKSIVSDWQAYLTIANSIENMKLVDLTFFTVDKDLFNSTIKDFEETIPETINTDPIKSRILALKTFLYKFQEIESIATTTNNEKLIAIKEIFVAFSNLNLQINKKVEKDNQNIIKPY